jgi:hypothetical protein
VCHESKYSTSKNWGPSIGHQKEKNINFLEKGYKDFHQVSVFLEKRPHTSVFFRNWAVGTLGAKSEM